MQPTELRLGNWVFNDENKPVQLVVIETAEFAEWNGSDSQYMFLEDGGYKYSAIKAIPLTPEILQKCGSPETKGLWYEHEISSFFLDGSGNFFAGEVLNVDSPVIAKNIKYLHQLQNLYFMLTGSELTVNL